MENDILYKRTKGDKLLVVPKSMQHEIIRKTHDTNGHSKDKKIFNKEYWMPEIKRLQK